jgi:hypothetical protein
MSGGPAFIDRGVFSEILSEVQTKGEKPYEDVATIYSDMSRFVVAHLANMSVADINKQYNDLGWGGNANGRAIHAAAVKWMELYKPQALKEQQNS